MVQGSCTSEDCPKQSADQNGEITDSHPSSTNLASMHRVYCDATGDHSPGGRRIPFVHLPRGRQPGGPKVIYVMNADGAYARRLSRRRLSLETLRCIFARPFRAEGFAR